MITLRVLLLADDPLARVGLAALLSGEEGLALVGQMSPDDADLTRAVDVFQPDVVLWDLGWGAQALDVEQLALLGEPRPPLVVLASAAEGAGFMWAASPLGLLLRERSAAQVAAALNAAAQGLLVVDPALAGGLRPLRADQAEQPVEELTAREREVLALLAEGASNKEIARALAVSENTVKYHVNAILGKLGAQSRTEAVVRATRAGLILL